MWRRRRRFAYISRGNLCGIGEMRNFIPKRGVVTRKSAIVELEELKRRMRLTEYFLNEMVAKVEEQEDQIAGLEEQVADVNGQYFDLEKKYDEMLAKFMKMDQRLNKRTF